ncbi:MAG: pyridoxal phosphate-dependent aminotransferase [Spirochaetales bacterium]|nr:pyridoxal phosphate-dependent aminotransferase [Spirochaetales bacterium]
MAISSHIKEMMEGSSFIRKMFETGAKLKEQYGDDNVYDFSLGNPDVPPIQKFTDTVIKIMEEDIPAKHGYMANAGFSFARKAVAAQVSKDQKADVDEQSVVMTCGAGGALNIVLKSILNPGDRVLVSSPCFMEYKFYADNHGGKLEIIKPKENFELDADAFEKAMGADVAAVILNSPNNPSGKIYSKENLNSLFEVLKKASDKYGRSIYVICDEPYRNIVFDGAEVPAVFPLYNNSIVVTSYSKNLSLPGERIGYVAANPAADDFDDLMNAVILCNRIMGFVNAPALMQRAVSELQGETVDISVYQRKRDLLCEELSRIGYEFEKPKGTFYLFIKAPGGDDAAFADLLLKERVLVVPGSGFAMPGYFRISYCVEDKTIKGSFSGFEKAFKQVCKNC